MLLIVASGKVLHLLHGAKTGITVEDLFFKRTQDSWHCLLVEVIEKVIGVSRDVIKVNIYFCDNRYILFLLPTKVLDAFYYS